MVKEMGSVELKSDKAFSLNSHPCRIGFYICHCGLNIAGKVDVKR